MTTSHDICTSMRNVSSLSHDDMITMLACFAAMVQQPEHALSSECQATIVDMLDEVTGQIEQDKIDQETASAWAGRDDSWMQRQDIACEVAA